VKDNLYTLGYAVVVGAICAGLLTGAAEFTAPYREANQRADEMRNILAVLEIPVGPRAGAEELTRIFDQRVREENEGSADRVFPGGGRPAGRAGTGGRRRGGTGLVGADPRFRVARAGLEHDPRRDVP
jgi:hypothetical protein